MAEDVLRFTSGEAHFVRILAWASFTGARRFTRLIADRIGFEAEAQPHTVSPRSLKEAVIVAA